MLTAHTRNGHHSEFVMDDGRIFIPKFKLITAYCGSIFKFGE
jgi:hypothetical protein